VLGFGGSLIQNTVKRQFCGTLEQNWRTTGLPVMISIPLQQLAD
jgi:hypothetical protein